MKSVSHRTLLAIVALFSTLAGPTSFAADNPDKKPAERPRIEPAEPKVPEPIRALLEDRKYAEAAKAIDQATGEKGTDHEWLAYLKARALYLATKYDDAVAAYKAAEQKFRGIL